MSNPRNETTALSDHDREMLTRIENRFGERWRSKTQQAKSVFACALCLIVVLFVIWTVAVAIWMSTSPTADGFGADKFGDAFGTVNALFAGLAFALLAATAMTQGTELEFTKEEVALARSQLVRTMQLQQQAADETRKRLIIDVEQTQLARTLDLFSDWGAIAMVRNRVRANLFLGKLSATGNEVPGSTLLRRVIGENQPHTHGTSKVPIHVVDANALLTVFLFWERVALLLRVGSLHSTTLHELFSAFAQEWLDKLLEPLRLAVREDDPDRTRIVLVAERISELVKRAQPRVGS